MATQETHPVSPSPGDSYVQSFARGLQVIRSFSASAPRQTLSEVAAASGLTRAGARRILLTLQTLGYVESDGRLFSLTARILDLGFAYLSSMPIWNRAEPVMEALVRKVQESCSAAVLEATDIVYVMRVPTHKIMSISLGVGSRLPAYCTSMGRLLLAELKDEEIHARLAASNREALTKHTVTDVDALFAKVVQARRQGWCLVNQELEEGLVSIAAPIVDRAGRAVAALNISGQANRTSAKVMQETMLPALLASASEISRLL
ncbi:IclR family transcriptional regulator C-terminal domain-containing protein [Variovorax sp. J22P240]|uniref:IclR family transcriptional regulator domain-containing protein n=1 Tax=unclassified Variovorax TaxID=663243 RepID=UPI002578AFC5|nr:MULTISPECIES: IclR family transcriptional regulator C-terminal domain-containing protein [unclassified Variovorax]MDL9999760.1 IclR family transcriptional regulator C-terminal domain-containing protein [Variovorax sp. J22P240]MDM0049184.1 IclR family transcriptional regulator C-terminal domain-containing protein [Variovorax sp. J22R115]